MHYIEMSFFQYVLVLTLFIFAFLGDFNIFHPFRNSVALFVYPEQVISMKMSSNFNSRKLKADLSPNRNKTDTRTYIVLGGAGNIGSYLSHELLNKHKTQIVIIDKYVKRRDIIRCANKLDDVRKYL